MLETVICEATGICYNASKVNIWS